MKKLFAVLFCILMMTGHAFAHELADDIDPVAMAKAPWKVGDKIVKDGRCEGIDYEREFLGISQSGLAWVQNFYASGEKLSSPFLMPVMLADKNAQDDSCLQDFEGRVTQWYKNGQKWKESHFKNGKKEGLWTVWYRNGQKMQEANYKNGQAEGLATLWYENGQKQMEFNDKNDGMENFVTLWHENGEKRIEGQFANGVMVGIWREWDENGRLVNEENYGYWQNNEAYER